VFGEGVPVGGVLVGSGCEGLGVGDGVGRVVGVLGEGALGDGDGVLIDGDGVCGVVEGCGELLGEGVGEVLCVA